MSLPLWAGRSGILHLHGFGLETLRDRPAFTRLFDELKLPCICPHGQRSWWADRICTEFDSQVTPERYILDCVLPYFRQRWDLAPGRSRSGNQHGWSRR